MLIKVARKLDYGALSFLGCSTETDSEILPFIEMASNPKAPPMDT